VTADLTPWLSDPDVLIRWIIHTGYGGAFSVLVPMGPEHWGPESEEWVFHMNYLPEDEAQFATDEQVIDTMKDRLGIADFEPKVHIITRWSVEGLLASTINAGRVFLVGDAAHRHPPTGGLGLNSAIHDVYNLCWKLSHVVQGKAGRTLLDTYQSERFPSFARNTQRSIENALKHLVIVDSLGIGPDRDAATCRDNVMQYWEDGAGADERRAKVFEAIASQPMEFKEHNVEYGFRADSAAVIPDGTLAPPNDDDMRIYYPDTRPGSPLPPCDRRTSRRVCSRTPLTDPRFVRVGYRWVQAAA
jgi:2,4-dichlorophenol 6-monooxygenase